MHKKAQVSETISWMIASLIIIIILLLSFLIVSTLSKGGTGGIRIIEISDKADLFVTKSFVAFLLTEDSNGKIYEQIKREENLNEFTGGLASSIFKKLYGRDYNFVWMAVYAKPNEIIHNQFFSAPPCVYGISEEIKLKENKFLLLTVTEFC